MSCGMDCAVSLSNQAQLLRLGSSWQWGKAAPGWSQNGFLKVLLKIQKHWDPCWCCSKVFHRGCSSAEKLSEFSLLHNPEVFPDSQVQPRANAHHESEVPSAYFPLNHIHVISKTIKTTAAKTSCMALSAISLLSHKKSFHFLAFTERNVSCATTCSW